MTQVQSNEVILELGGGIAWNHSYVTADKMCCVYEAEDPNCCSPTARRAGFPVDVVLEVTRTIGPSTAG